MENPPLRFFGGGAIGTGGTTGPAGGRSTTFAFSSPVPVDTGPFIDGICGSVAGGICGGSFADGICSRSFAAAAALSGRTQSMTRRYGPYNGYTLYLVTPAA